MRTGYHVVYEKSFEEAIEFASANGFDFVQFDLGVPTFFLDGKTDRELASLCTFAEEHHVEITFHGPCDNVSLFSDYPAIRKGILDQYALILYKANILKARHITVHTGKHPQFKINGSSENAYLIKYGQHYRDVLHENIAELSGMSGNVLICIENDGFTLS